MATKKRTKVPAPSAGDEQRPESMSEVETSRTMNVDTDVEHADSNAPPAIGSIESDRAETERIDVERGGENDAGDVERGPA